MYFPCSYFPRHIPLNMFSHSAKTTQVRIFRFNVLTTFSWTLFVGSYHSAMSLKLEVRITYCVTFKRILTLDLQRSSANVLASSVTCWATDTKLCRGERSKRVSKTAVP